MYTELKKQMKAAGYKVSEGNEIFPEDQQNIRDFHFFNGRDPIIESYKIMFQSSQGYAEVVPKPIVNTSPDTRNLESSTGSRSSIESSIGSSMTEMTEMTSNSEEEFSKD